MSGTGSASPSASGRKPRKSGKRRRGLCLEDRPVNNPNAAGIDVGAREIFVAMPPGRDEEPVRVFSTFTEDLERMADWLVGRGITTVAMESTGVYWIPLYEILEQRQLELCLTDARHMKNVPGRRTDWHECQWIQYLHSVGLLRAAFRPPEQVCAVRTLMRHRGQLVEMACQHVQHMHKALTQMNLQIHHVLSDITGQTGLAIVDAILSGERDPDVLARLRDGRVKASPEVVRKSLVGTWRLEHLFTLRQSRALYGAYQAEVAACDEQIEQLLGQFSPRVDPDQRPLPPGRTKRQARPRNRTLANGESAKPRSALDLRTEVYKLFGVDVTQIPGIAVALALNLFTEIGRDLSKWPTSSEFASWLGLCTDNDKTGGRVVYRGARRGKHRAGQLFRLAAYSLHRTPGPLGDYLRRMKAKLGPRAATTATAHKIAVIFYTIVRNQVEYDATIWAARDAARARTLEAKLRRQAKSLGYQLVPMPEQPAA